MYILFCQTSGGLFTSAYCASTTFFGFGSRINRYYFSIVLTQPIYRYLIYDYYLWGGSTHIGGSTSATTTIYQYRSILQHYWLIALHYITALLNCTERTKKPTRLRMTSTSKQKKEDSAISFFFSPFFRPCDMDEWMDGWVETASPSASRVWASFIWLASTPCSPWGAGVPRETEQIKDRKRQNKKTRK